MRWAIATRQGYNGLGQTTIVTDTMGRVTRMGYDGQGTLRWSQAPRLARSPSTSSMAWAAAIATIANYHDGVVSGGEPSDQDLISRTVYDAGCAACAVLDPVDGVTAFTYDNARSPDRRDREPGDRRLQPGRPATCRHQYQYDRAGQPHRDHRRARQPHGRLPMTRPTSRPAPAMR